MQNPIQRVIAAVAALLALSLALVAYTGSTRTVTHIVVKTTTATKTVAAPAPKPIKAHKSSAFCQPQTAAEDAKTGRQALAYLTSKQRLREFERIVPKAGIVIAQALQAGKFGKVFRYDSNKVALQPHETGWGGISTTNRNKTIAFAWVYWNRDGSIDYSKPITQVALNRTGDRTDNTAVFIFGPDKYASDYWNVNFNNGKKVEATPLLDTKDPQLDPCEGATGPTDVGGIAVLDTRALNQFVANMNNRFGLNWNK